MTATTTSSVALEEIRVVPDDGAASARSHDSFVTCEDETPLTSPESARHHSQQQQQGRLPEVAETDAEDAEEAEPSTSVRAEGLKEIVYWDCENDNDDGASSASKEDAPYCRICFDGPIENDPLFRACDCKGSVAYVHHSCLSKWVSDSQRTSCELCGAAFRVPEGIRPFVPKTAILHKACTVAADSLARSAALLNLLPQSSGAVTTNSAIIYLRGYGHQVSSPPSLSLISPPSSPTLTPLSLSLSPSLCRRGGALSSGSASFPRHFPGPSWRGWWGRPSGRPSSPRSTEPAEKWSTSDGGKPHTTQILTSTYSLIPQNLI